MRFNCVYFDDEMSLTQEVRLTRNQLAAKGVEVKNINYGFVIRKKALVDIPKSWDFILENSTVEDIKWNQFIFDGTLFLVGISYFKD